MKGPQILCIFVKQTESKSPKTHGQSTLLNQLIKCAVPTLEIYSAFGITAISILFKLSRMQQATREAISRAYLIVLGYLLFSMCHV